MAEALCDRCPVTRQETGVYEDAVQFEAGLEGFEVSEAAVTCRKADRAKVRKILAGIYTPGWMESTMRLPDARNVP